MISTLAISLLIALAASAIVIFLAIGLSSGFQMGALHWLGAALCVIVSTVFISAAVGASKALKAVNRTAEQAGMLAQGVDGLVQGATQGATQGTAANPKSLLGLIPEEYRDMVGDLVDQYAPGTQEQNFNTAPGVSVKPLADSYIESIRRPLEKKLRSATIWSIVVTVVLNLILLVLLLNAGSKASNKRYSSDDDFLGSSSDLDLGGGSGSRFNDDDLL